MAAKALRGVNLGGWLVIERWMTPSVFAGTEAHDEKSLAGMGERTRDVIKKHHWEFITEADFAWIASSGLEAVRIPVGYWIFGDEPPFTGSIERLDFAFETAEKHKLKILLDIHGAAGSQNGKRHSGLEGKASWYKQKSKTLLATERLAKRYGTSKALWGIELLNEPKMTLSTSYHLIRYYKQAQIAISQYAPSSVKIIIGVDNWTAFWAGYARELGLALDLHYYHSFGEVKKRLSLKSRLKNARKAKKEIEILQTKAPVVIGEWSAVLNMKLPDEEKDEAMRSYAKAQIQSYDAANAWFYWSYKTESPGSWNLRSLVEQGVIDIKSRN